MMASLAKLLVLLAIFLLASYANGFLSLSLATELQVWINHLIRLEEPTNKPTCKPTNDRMNDQTSNEMIQQLEQDALLPDNRLSK